MPHRLDRWMYRGGRPNRVARFPWHGHYLRSSSKEELLHASGSVRETG